jgi:DNA-binding NarL/FixJ family response regulator
MRLVIADDHPIVLEGLEALLRSAGHVIVGRCTDGAQVLQTLANGDSVQ